MTSEQQQQTLAHFNAGAQAWRAKAEGADATRVNIIAQRNGIVQRVVAQLPAAGRLLDIGCGTGELVLAAARAGLTAVGIDFAPEMIALCERARPGDLAARATFVHASAFDYEADAPFDVVSAQGFIEYISFAQLVELVARARRLLAPGGALVLGSRNRLFNLASLNSYTAMEQALGTLPALLDEAIALSRATTLAEGVAVARAHARGLAQPERHPGTGIGVATRHQYTPGELCAVLEPAGLELRGVYAVHYHALPPAAAKDWPAIHVEVAGATYELAPGDPRLLPFASSFVLDARKT